MKIILVNNLFCRTNGADIMTYHLYQMLNGSGHQTYIFAGNKKPYFEPDYPYQHFFPEAKELSDFSKSDYITQAFKPIFNWEAYTKLKDFIKEVKPDLAHLHGIQRYLSPSVIKACKEAKIPVVMTLHDPFYACPASTLMRSGETYCEELLCLRQGPAQCLKNRCMRGNFLKSLYTALEFKLRSWHKLYNEVDHFLTPSYAFRDLLIKAGLPKDKVTPIYNCIEDHYFEEPLSSRPGTYILYVGRLVQEKGLNYLLHAMALCPNVTLKIVGEGPFRSELEKIKNTLGLSNVEFLGFQNGKVLMQIYKNCIATVLPCNWFETFGLTIAESFALGKPVVASAIGAIPELIDHGIDGFLVPPSEVLALAKAIQEIVADPERAHNMGLSGRKKTIKLFTSQRYYENTIQFYEQFLKNQTVSNIGR